MEECGIAARIERGAADSDAAAERAVECEECGGFGESLPVEVPLVRSTAGAGPGHKVGVAIGIEVGAGNADAASERSVVGQKTSERRRADAVEHFHVRSAASTGASDNVGAAVVIEIAGRHEDAAGKRTIVRQEAGHGRAVRARTLSRAARRRSRAR